MRNTGNPYEGSATSPKFQDWLTAESQDAAHNQAVGMLVYFSFLDNKFHTRWVFKPSELQQERDTLTRNRYAQLKSGVGRDGYVVLAPEAANDDVIIMADEAGE